MKNILILALTLCTFGAHAFDVAVTKTWAPQKVKECNDQSIGYTIYSLGQAQVDACNFFEVELSIPVQFYRCSDSSKGFKYQKVDPRAVRSIDYKRYSRTDGGLYDDVYLERYESIEFVSFTDDYKILSQGTYSENTINLTIDLTTQLSDDEIMDAINGESKSFKINVAPRILKIVEDTEGVELYRDFKMWDQVSLKLELNVDPT